VARTKNQRAEIEARRAKIIGEQRVGLRSKILVMKYFDYESVAREAKIPEEKLRKLVKIVRQEFPHDPMMAELHRSSGSTGSP
jgi:hypothetical protein